jgi:hypothetical protein
MMQNLERVPEAIPIARTKYRKPPVVERALIVHLGLPIPEEKFQVKADEWRSALVKDFPHLETLTEWTLRVVEKDGMPVLDTAGQKMTLRQTFWQIEAGDKKKQGIQLWQDKISFNLLGELGNPRDFDELEQLTADWLPRWSADFEISQFSGVTLQYVNLLSKETLPAFMENDQLKIGEAIRLFGGVPVQRNLLLPPYDFQVNVRVDNAEPRARVSAQCVSVEAPPNKGPTMHLRFTATTNLGQPARSVSLDKVRDEARLTHSLIIEAFEAYFTDAAKASFEPYADNSSRNAN